MRKIYDRICYQDDDNAIAGVVDTVESGEELEVKGELEAAEVEQVEDAEKQHEKDGTWPEGTPQWVKDRVNKTTRQKYELKTALEREKARADEAEKKLREKEKTEVGAAPSRDDFEDEDAYIDARAEWNYKRLRAADSVTEKATAESVQREASEKDFDAKVKDLVKAGSKKHDNFVDTVESVPGHIFNQQMVEAIIASGVTNKNAEDVAMFLATNLDQAEEISQLSPLQRAAALGSLSAKLATPKPTKTTKAPDPITPVRGKGSPSGEVPDDIDGIAAILWKNKGKY